MFTLEAISSGKPPLGSKDAGNSYLASILAGLFRGPYTVFENQAQSKNRAASDSNVHSQQSFRERTPTFTAPNLVSPCRGRKGESRGGGGGGGWRRNAAANARPRRPAASRRPPCRCGAPRAAAIDAWRLPPVGMSARELGESMAVASGARGGAKGPRRQEQHSCKPRSCAGG